MVGPSANLAPEDGPTGEPPASGGETESAANPTPVGEPFTTAPAALVPGCRKLQAGSLWRVENKLP